MQEPLDLEQYDVETEKEHRMKDSTHTGFVKRRQFLRASMLGLAAVAADQKGGLLMGQPLGLPVGLELFTLRNEGAQDFLGILEKVAAIGYKEVELFDFYGRKASEVRRLLSSTGLAAPSCHTLSYVLRPQYPLSEVRARWEGLIQYASALGAHYLGGSVGDVSKLNPLDDYKRLADLMNAVGEQCQRAGLQFAYHNVNAEFQEYDGVVPYDWLLLHTDPQAVQLEIDVYWLTRAGRDPVDYFTKYPGRTPLLHVKDRKPGYAPTTILDPGPGPFTEVGHGCINWKRIFAAAPGGGLKHYYVEQDFCERPVFESLKMSYDYLKNLTI
jgi:sugar phosphate isomerase/epimerase